MSGKVSEATNINTSTREYGFDRKGRKEASD